MILEYKGKTPKIGKDVFIAPNAVIIGEVEIEEGASIWYGAVIRGDMALIRIGKNSNIQDNCTVHADTDKPTHIGAHVTVGHNAVIHGCTIEDSCLIGINSAVLNEAVVKTGSIVAAGSVVKEKQMVGPYHLVIGAPAQLKKEMGEDITELLAEPARIYAGLAAEHSNLKF